MGNRTPTRTHQAKTQEATIANTEAAALAVRLRKHMADKTLDKTAEKAGLGSESGQHLVRSRDTHLPLPSR